MQDSPQPTKTFPTIELAILSASVLEALVAGSIDRASEAFGRTLPDYLIEYNWLWSYRLAQVTEDPATNPWLVRVVIDSDTREIVGHAGFHGPPNENGMVEIGYTIAENYRRRGYARATTAALIEFAAADPTVTTVRASIRPDNVASLATVRPFGFTQVGEQMDEIDGLEYVYELRVRS